MEKTIFYVSENGNTYMYDDRHKMNLCIHPIIEKFYELDKKNINVENWKEETLFLLNNTDDYNHQVNKYFYLKKNGFFTHENQNSVIYTSNESNILNNLEQINHIVFEVTDKCNLSCYYCGYGELYSNHDARHKKHMKQEDAIALINYFVEIWEKMPNKTERIVYFSFFGGEPLLNFNLIEFLVNYIRINLPSNIRPIFSMTTNGMLIEKYIDFLIKHNFLILVSLDGDKFSNSYRTQLHGGESYDIVYKQLKKIKSEYPLFFNTNINFNSVLHDRNSTDAINTYFKEEFNKKGNISILNPHGVSQDKLQLFEKIYKEKEESLDSLRVIHLLRNSVTRKVITFIKQYTDNYYEDLTDFYNKKKTHLHYPCTGTCSPFSKEIFLTVNGKLLPCERIGHTYPLGTLNNGKLVLNTKQISSFYSSIYKKIIRQCRKCYMIGSCTMCIFNMKNLQKPSCGDFGTKEHFKQYLSSNISLFETNRSIYNIIMTNISLK